MSLRNSLKNLIRRDPSASLRERAAATASRLGATRSAASTATADPTAGTDPVLSAIEEGRRLLSASREAFKLPDVGLDPHPDREAVQDAVWAHFRGPICSTAPTTARGCAELARYVGEFREFQGVELGDELMPILANIAGSPLVNVGAAVGHYPDIRLVDLIDLPSATMRDLEALHDTADLVGGVAYAVVWQARCKLRGHADHYNAAGKLMQSLGDALTSVETAAVQEAKRRTPVSQDDREIRLKLMSRSILENGDADETRAFARELAGLAHEQGA